jgi:sec-independent protein translocase protein TatA
VLSVPDIAVIGALALMFFGPDQLPKVARRVGHVMRDIQSTSQSFIREFERAADADEPPEYPQPAHAEAPNAENSKPGGTSSSDAAHGSGVEPSAPAPY